MKLPRFFFRMTGFVGCALVVLMAGSSFAQSKVQGESEPIISVNPPVKSYGNVHLGSLASQTFQVRNTGPGLLVVDTTYIAGPDSLHFSIFNSLVEFNVPQDDSQAVAVRFSPTSVGAKTAVLRIVSNDPQQDTLDVDLSGTGVVSEISVSPSPYDYGDVYVDSSATQTFVVTNEGSGDLVVNVNGVSLNGATTQFSILSGLAPFTLAPNETWDIDVRFLPTSEGQKTAYLQIISNDPDESVFQDTLSGAGVLPNIVVNPTSHDYGDVHVGDDSLKKFLVINTGTGNLLIDSLKVVGPEYQDFTIQSEAWLNVLVEGPEYVVAPGDTIDVTVKFSPSFDDAESATLKIYSNDPDQPVVDVSLSGNGVVAEITVDPSSFDYDSVAVNFSKSKTFVIGNDGTGDLFVSSMFISGGVNSPQGFGPASVPTDFEITDGFAPFTIAPGNTHLVTVDFAPLSTGQKFGNLVIDNNDLGEGDNPFVVELTGKGILEPEITLAPPINADYGSVVLGSDSSRTIVVANDGSANLVVNINGTQLLGDTANQFDILSGGAPFSLAPQQSRNIVVKFTPTSTGVKSDTLRIESNDPDEELYYLVLTGSGVVPDIAATPTSKNYGNVQVSSNASQIFTVSNTGTSNLVVNAGGTTLVNSEDGQYAIISGGAPFTLEPNESREIVVRFTPTTPGTKTDTLRIVSNDPDENPLNVALTGKGVISAISVNPSSLDFGTVALTDSADRALTITNIGDGDLVIPNDSTYFVGADSSEFIIVSGGAPFNLAPAQSNQIVLRFKPTDTGEKDASLHIVSNDTTNNGVFDVPLTATGIAEPDIAVNPTSWNYGSVLLGSSASKTFFVTNEGTAELVVNINGITLSGEDLDEFDVVDSTGAPFDVAPGDTHRVIVTFSPLTAGAKSATLRIDNNDPDPEEEQFFVELSGTGVGIPDIVVDPTSKDFGGVHVGNTAQQNVLITNVGTDNLIINIGQVVISGEDQDQFSVISFGDPLPFNLAPSASQTLVVSFSPTSAGEKGATLLISSNDPDESPFSAPLSGNGLVEPDIAVNPPSKDYGNVLVESSSSQIFVISNLGSGNLVVGVDSTTLAGVNPDQFTIVSGGAPFTLEPAGTREITVSFNPGNPGAKSAVLQILSNDPDESSKTVELSGVGVDPEANAPFAPIDLTPEPSGWTNAASITLGWTNPDHPMSITGARYKYDGIPGSPTDGTLVSGDDITTIIKSTDASLLGTKTWYVWLVDSDGKSSHVNRSETTTQFDNLAPATTSNAKATYYTSDAVITLSSSDAHSGVDATSFKVNNGGTQNGTVATITTEGNSNTLEFWSVDVAGNVETHHVTTIKIDKTKPSSQAGAPASSGSNTFNVPFSASDNLSGVSSVELWYRWNSTVWQKYSGTFTTSPINFTALFGPGVYDFEVVATDSAGNLETRNSIVESSTLVTSVARQGSVPEEFALYQNYPNPFNPETTIEYALPRNEKVRIIIYDINGQLVRTLIDGVEHLQGYHQEVWNGRNDRDESVSSGVYFYRILAGSYTKTLKMMLVK